MATVSLDLATGDDASSKIGVMLGKGDGTFEAATDYPAGNTHTIATGDLDVDGHLDLVAGGYDERFVRILRGQGDGTFEAESPDREWCVRLELGRRRPQRRRQA